MTNTIARSVAQKAVDVLNESFAADPDVIRALVNHRVVTRVPDAESPAVYMQKESGEVALGMFGVINGIVERQTGLRLCALFRDDKAQTLIGFGILDDVLKKQPAERVKKVQ